MLTGPADQTAAAPDGYSHGRMRTSRADREQAIDALKVAYVQGRLTKDEFDERLTGSRHRGPPFPIRHEGS